MSVAHQIIGAAGKESRPKSDFYPTPPHATEALLRVEAFDGLIQEPACGQGHISRVLLAAGCDVWSTDLFNRGYGEAGVDFLFFPPPQSVDHVITNPPYSLAQKFVETALKVARHKVAMLLKIQFLEGVTRQKFLRLSPLRTVYVFSRRLDLNRLGEPQSNKGMITFAWFVWEHGYGGAPHIDWL
jgi:hypothetical protein